MEVKEYENARIFLSDYETVLLERESVSQLVLYNAYQSLIHPLDEKKTFGAVLDEGRVILLFSNVMPYNLAVYAVQMENLTLASMALADFLASNHIAMNGINARYDICQSFMEQYKKYVNCSFTEKQGMDIMEIREVNEIKPVEGTQRLALPEEAKLATEWMIEFQLEARTSEMDYEAALERANKLIREGKIYLYENSDQKVVTMAIAARKLVHGVAVTYVYTPQEYRGNGYAAANMYYLSKELLEQGYEFCTLFVDKKNPLSNRAYEKVGFKVLEDNYEYKVVPAEA